VKPEFTGISCSLELLAFAPSSLLGLLMVIGVVEVVRI
jgi:hypothetical protein